MDSQRIRKDSDRDIFFDADDPRERAFKEVLQLMKFALDSGKVPLNKLIAAVLSDEIISRDQKPLDPEQLTSVQYLELTSLSASELAGHQIVRPVLIVGDESQYLALSAIFGDQDAASPAAFYLQFKGRVSGVRNIIGSAFRQSGIIISRSANPTIFGHEVRHTIDRHKRRGFDNLLSEVFACATDFLQNPTGLKKVLQSYYTVSLAEEKEIERAKMLSGEGNSPRFGTYDKTEQWFAELIAKVVDQLFSRISAVGKISAQRELAKCKTLEEYLGS